MYSDNVNNAPCNECGTSTSNFCIINRIYICKSCLNDEISPYKFTVDEQVHEVANRKKNLLTTIDKTVESRKYDLIQLDILYELKNINQEIKQLKWEILFKNLFGRH